MNNIDSELSKNSNASMPVTVVDTKSKTTTLPAVILST